MVKTMTSASILKPLGSASKSRQRLKLNSRGRHALMALCEISRQTKGKPLPLSVVSETGDISLSYLEQLFAGLRRAGIVHSTRGPGGGYMLAKDPEDITLASIYVAAEDSVPGRRPSDEGYITPHTAYFLTCLEEANFVILNGYTLADVLNQNIHSSTSFNKLFDIF